MTHGGGELTRVITSGAPPAMGPYCQAISRDGLLFCSGQIPLDPQTGELAAGGIDALTKCCLANLEAICEAAGTELRRALKVTVYLTDMADFEQMNEAYEDHFGSQVPARTTFAVAALPLGARVEIDAIVALEASTAESGPHALE